MASEDEKMRARRDRTAIREVRQLDCWKYVERRFAEEIEKQVRKLRDETLPPEALKHEQMRLAGMEKMAKLLDLDEQSCDRVIGPESVPIGIKDVP